MPFTRGPQCDGTLILTLSFPCEKCFVEASSSWDIGFRREFSFKGSSVTCSWRIFLGKESLMEAPLQRVWHQLFESESYERSSSSSESLKPTLWEQESYGSSFPESLIPTLWERESNGSSSSGSLIPALWERESCRSFSSRSLTPALPNFPSSHRIKLRKLKEQELISWKEGT